MKKVLAILLAGMITASALAGCGGGGGDTSKSEGGSADGSKAEGSQAAAKIDPSWPDASLFADETDIELKVWAPDAAVTLVKKQVEAFQKHYSEVKFKKIEVTAQGESDAAGMVINDPDTAADVFGFPSDQIDRLVAAQVLSPVTKGFAATVEANNDEKPVTAIKQKDGSMLAYPETNDNGYYLVYDKRIVTDEDAKTLEGILEACKKGNRQFVMDAGNGFYACTFAFTAGVKTAGLTESGAQKFEEYDEEEAVATLMAFAQLMKDYKGTFSSQDVASISTGFKNKTVGAGIDGPWNSKMDKAELGDNLGAAKLPTVKVNGQDKQMISLFGYKYIGVNSHTKFQRSAQILAYYLTGQEAQEQRAEELGWGPSNLEAVKKYADDPILLALQEQSKNSVPSIEIKQTIWAGMGTLGSSLYKDSWKPDDKAATKKLLDNVISIVKDEEE